MTWGCKSQRGITLIELLVVIAIMMSLLSLVAPFGVNIIEKASMQSERIQLRGIIKKAAHSAFIASSTVTILLRDHRVVVTKINSADSEYIFEYLYFSEPQTLILNRNGFPSLAELAFQSSPHLPAEKLPLSFLSDLNSDVRE